MALTVALPSWQPVLKPESSLFHCPQCDQVKIVCQSKLDFVVKGFRQRSNCAAHHRAVHLNMKETCPHFGKAFKKLKPHIRDVHAAKNLVKCDQCDKKYPEGRLFKEHMNKTHMSSLNDEPLAKYLETTICPVCGDTLLATR